MAMGGAIPSELPGAEYMPDQSDEWRRLLEESRASGGGGGGMNPMSALNMYQQFAGGGETAAGGATGGGEAAAAGTGEAAGGASGAGSLASFWPAAVALAAIGNEVSAHNHNYNWTDKEGNEHKDPLRPNGWKDAITGDALHYDMERRYLPWLNKHIDGLQSSGMSGDLQMFADLGSPGRWDDAIKNGLKDGTAGKIFKKLKDLF